MKTGNLRARSLIVASAALIFPWLLASCQVAPPTAIATDLGVIETLPVTSVSVETPTDSPIGTPTPAPQPTVPLILEASEVGYIIPLHVQHKTQDQLMLMFELDTALAGRVYWWPAEGSHQNAGYIPFEAGAARQLIRIPGLAAGQTYQMAVGLEGDDSFDRMPLFLGEPWGPIEVSTLSEPLTPITIGVVGDSGFGEDITADLAAQLAQHQPDFIVHTGDLVYLAYQEGSPQAAYQQKWYQTLSSLLRKTVIYPVVGNHEMDDDTTYEGVPYYFHAFPIFEGLEGGWPEAPEGAERQWYALELGALQIIFLNTQQLYGGAGRAAQDAWLTTRLQDDSFDATMVVFHVPPFTSGRHGLDDRVVASSWVQAFEQSNVFLILSGHDHNYERLEQNGITYVVSGGGSTLLYPRQEQLAQSIHFEAKSHYVLLEISEKSVGLQVYDADGQLIDTTTLAWQE